MWLLLVHQIPPDPGYLRVKVRRRLRRIGAAALKSTVYVLPNSESAREDFEWLAQEIRADGGDAVLCEARFLSGTSDEDVRDLFRAKLDVEYAEVVREVREIGSRGAGEGDAAQLTRARRRLAALVKLDFFGARGRHQAEQAISEAEARLTGPAESPTGAKPRSLRELRGKVWVTRRGVHVDRMGSAWLIRRFLDPQARFRFVDPEGYRPAPGEVRFDMYDAEFTHAGDRCTFEVLSALVDPYDVALQAVAEIVHDVDLRDRKFGRVETPGVERLVTGLQRTHDGDAERIDLATELFEGLYRSFGGAG